MRELESFELEQVAGGAASEKAKAWGRTANPNNSQFNGDPCVPPEGAPNGIVKKYPEDCEVGE
jgi:hypothetical protein